MCNTPKAPAPPPVMAEAPTTPTILTGGTTSEEDRKRRSAGKGTLLTGPRGVQESAPTVTKTLLGQ